MNEISNGNMVKGWLKVIILFKTAVLPKCFAPHNVKLVISNHSYVEVSSGSRPLRQNEVQLYKFECVVEHLALIWCLHV